MSGPALDPSQQRAVAHRDGPAIVLAGPGAGKTRVLTERAAALVRDGVDPAAILLLTFTNNAARKMLQRAKEIDGRCERVSGGTFHSTAMKVINRNAHIFGNDKPFTVIDPEDSTEIVRRIIDGIRNPKGDGAGEDGAAGEKTDAERDEGNWPKAKSVRNAISYAVNTRIPLDTIIRARWADNKALQQVAQQIADEYTSYKLERRMIDYDDAIEYFLALLQDPEIGPEVRRQWRYVMIDEYQDVNRQQEDLVDALLAAGTDNVMVVGDPSQAIFSFRGSAPETMLAFKRRHPATEVITLDTNYRSTPRIVAAVNAIDRSLGIGFDRTLVANASDPGSAVRLIETADANHDGTTIVKAILDHKREGGKIADHAVLVRSMSFARLIEGAFMAARIPYKVVGGIRIDEAAHVKDLLSIARLSTNHALEPAWSRLLKKYPKIGQQSADRIAARLSALPTPAEVPAILAEEAKAKKTEFTGLVKALAALDGGPGPANQLDGVLAAMETFWASLWKEEWQDRSRDIDAVIAIAERHPDIDSFLTAVTLDYSLDRKNREDEEKDEEEPVTISTIHGAKGLEWPFVHIPNFVRGHIPSVYAEDQREEARLLYVACSRPMKELLLYRPGHDARNYFTQPSDFERLLTPHVERRRAGAAAMAAAGGPVQTDRRIDMSVRLLKR